MTIDSSFSIECLSGVRKLNVSLLNKIITVEITQPCNTSEGIRDKPVGNVRLDADGLLALENDILRCLPFTIDSTIQANQVRNIGIPISRNDIQRFLDDRDSRSFNLNERGLFAKFMQSFLETSDNTSMEILIDVFRDMLLENTVHCRLLRQQLEAAAGQIQNNIKLRDGHKNEIEESNHFGTITMCNVVDINQLTRQATSDPEAG